MPRSKRAKVVSLTKVKKRSKDKKDAVIEDIRDTAGTAQNVVLVSLNNERNTFLQEIRAKLRPSKLICAKNKQMQLALGTVPAQECQTGIHRLSQRIGGHCGLLFTDKTIEEIQAIFESFMPLDFARSGAVAMDTVKLPKGSDTLSKLPHSIETHLRQLGLPTQLKEGKILLLGDHTICTKGKELSSDAAQILKLLDFKQARFKVTAKAVWNREAEKVQILVEDEADMDDDDEEEEDEEEGEAMED